MDVSLQKRSIKGRSSRENISQLHHPLNGGGEVFSTLPQPSLPVDNKTQARYFKSRLKIVPSENLSPSLSSMDKVAKQGQNEKEIGHSPQTPQL